MQVAQMAKEACLPGCEGQGCELRCISERQLSALLGIASFNEKHIWPEKSCCNLFIHRARASGVWVATVV